MTTPEKTTPPQIEKVAQLEKLHPEVSDVVEQARETVQNIHGAELFASEEEALQSLEGHVPLKKNQGQDFIASTSKILEIKELGHGYEGKVYSVLIEEKDGTTRMMVIKKFSSKISKSLHYDEQREIEECIFASKTAILFKEQGLPVLPVVKSIIAKKGLKNDSEAEKFITEQNIMPPFVLMTQVFGDQSSDQHPSSTKVLTMTEEDDESIYEEILKHPAILDDMTRDLAKIHRLGFVMGTLPENLLGHEIKKHPVHSLWFFTKRADGKLDRWLVDLNNLSKGKYYDRDEREVRMSIDRMEDVADACRAFSQTLEKDGDEKHFLDVYNEEYSKA